MSHRSFPISASPNSPELTATAPTINAEEALVTAPTAATSFADFNLNPALQRAVDALGFTAPTPIQSQSVPPAMLGRDVLACAMTGSGKTAAFALPILQRLVKSGAGMTRALILAPTRELAAQISEHINDLARFTTIRSAAVFGGVGMGPQQQAFEKGVEIIVATPGRLLDHFQYQYADLQGLQVLVLDEADRMLDMGFLPDIRKVLRHLPTTRRQTLFFSATMPDPIVQLSHEMLHHPVMLNIERQAKPATGVSQTLYPVSSELKSHLMLELLKDPQIKNVLAFTRTKHRANRLADFLDRHGVSCARIHGNRSQLQRTQALAGFKDGTYRVLVATDIAARGIDVEALSHVVNFDVPHIVEDYIHRVGRTARAEMVGDAWTLVSPDEEADLRQIERHLNRRLPRKTLPDFDYNKAATERLEIPLGERIAAIRARKSEERARARAKAERKAANAGTTGRSAGTRSTASSTTSSQPTRAPRPAHAAHGRRGPAPTRHHSERQPTHAAQDANRRTERPTQAMPPAHRDGAAAQQRSSAAAPAAHHARPQPRRDNQQPRSSTQSQRPTPRTQPRRDDTNNRRSERPAPAGMPRVFDWSD